MSITLNEKAAASLLPPRPAESNKGTFGRVVALCGSAGMSGAAYLCAKAAYRAGCGLVEVLTPEVNRIIIQSSLPEAVVTVYDPSDGASAAQIVKDAAGRADAIAAGCGLGRSDASSAVLSALLAAAASPTVLDADALNMLALRPELWSLIKAPVAVTPHPLEMSRLTGLCVGEIVGDIPGAARDLAARRGVVCALKDHSTAVSDGRVIYVNRTGNSGMATAGAGDVLCGIIASLLAQGYGRGLSVLDAAALGVYVHGLAGDAAAAALGEYSVMASDIIDYLPAVLLRLSASRE